MTLTFLAEMIVQEVLGAEPRRGGHCSNHYTGVRLFIASFVWFHELYFLGRRVALHKQKMSNDLIPNYCDAGFGASSLA